MSRFKRIKTMGGSRLGLAIVAAVATAVVIGGVSYASIPNPSGVINACYKTSGTNHALSVINTAHTAHCPSGYTSLNWSQTGPQGPQGVQGPQGAPATQCEVTDVTTPATYTDLQTALSDASSGDTLDITGVCTGDYTDSLANLSLTGSPAAELNGNNAQATVLTVGSGDNVTITNLLITGGNSQSFAGGGIDDSGTVTLDGDTQVDHNTSSYFSGGILVQSGGTLTLNDNAQVDENPAGHQGGGIYSQGTVTLNDNAQVDGNSGCQGGGIYINAGTVTLNGNAQVDHNSGCQGGGIWDAENPVVVNLTGNAQVEGNTASSNAGIFDDGGGAVNTCEWTGAISPNSPDDPPAVTPYTGCTG